MIQPEQRAEFLSELTHLINKHSQENGSGTPDFILASFLTTCLDMFDTHVNKREEWYGREQDERFGTPEGGFGRLPAPRRFT